jgi:predicted unusual protein kinase regulating ubiquinone biosynthesis (AarF/ABC1/UbiB family)
VTVPKVYQELTAKKLRTMERLDMVLVCWMKTNDPEHFNYFHYENALVACRRTNLLLEIVGITEDNGLKLPQEFGLLVKQTSCCRLV